MDQSEQQSNGAGKNGQANTPSEAPQAEGSGAVAEVRAQAQAPAEETSAGGNSPAQAVDTESAVETESHVASRAPDSSETAAADDERRELAAERDKLREQLLRTAADFDNFRKRSRRDVEDARARGSEDIVREFLPVIDNLERAVEAGKDATEVGAILEGVQMVLKLFEDTASRLGLERIDAVGHSFDPARHEAIQQIESPEHAPGSIVGQVAPGYLMGGRLLRAAMVVVARRASTPPAKPQDKSAEEDETS